MPDIHVAAWRIIEREGAAHGPRTRGSRAGRPRLRLRRASVGARYPLRSFVPLGTRPVPSSLEKEEENVEGSQGSAAPFESKFSLDSDSDPKLRTHGRTLGPAS